MDYLLMDSWTMSNKSASPASAAVPGASANENRRRFLVLLVPNMSCKSDGWEVPTMSSKSDADAWEVPTMSSETDGWDGGDGSTSSRMSNAM